MIKRMHVNAVTPLRIAPKKGRARHRLPAYPPMAVLPRKFGREKRLYRSPAGWSGRAELCEFRLKHTSLSGVVAKLARYHLASRAWEMSQMQLPTTDSVITFLSVAGNNTHVVRCWSAGAGLPARRSRVWASESGRPYQVTMKGGCMSRHNEMPPVPPANRSPRGGGTRPETKRDTTSKMMVENTAEQGQTANIKQNTTNSGYFHGRVK